MDNSSQNPYASPTTPNVLATEIGGDELATLSSRFVGSLVDGIILLIAIVPIAMCVGFVVASLGMDVETIAGEVLISILMLPLIALVFLAINGYLLAKRGQTVGKVLVKTRIVDDSGQLPQFMPMFLKRYVVLWAISLVPIVGRFFGFIDAIFIFNADRKCIHDRIAGTKVVKVRG